jgi:hypothetical protein
LRFARDAEEFGGLCGVWLYCGQGCSCADANDWF